MGEDPIGIAKRAAAVRACDFVEDGMVVGLGTGSTASHMIRELGRRVREGLRLVGVPTSEAAARLATEVGIQLADLEGDVRPDLTIDGADEADGSLNLIKGGGGALLREKIVAVASDRMIAIADASKRVSSLGVFPLPVEVVPFGLGATRRGIADALENADVMGGEIDLRQRDGAAFRTDGGHLILDLRLRRIGDPQGLDAALKAVPGVVETGLFCGICETLVLGHGDGRTEILQAGGAGDAVPDNAFAEL
jgi:ribose 5-phosphate isomerase A